MTVLNHPPSFNPALTNPINVMINTTYVLQWNAIDYTPDVDNHGVTLTMGTLPSYGTYYSGLNKIELKPKTTADICA